MKKLLLGIGVLLALVVIAALVVPMLIPASVYEEQIEKRASETLGRQVTIEGAPAITVFPTRAKVQGLMVANAEGFDAPHLVAVDEADIGVKLIPLLSGRVEITQFILREPDIRLQANDRGSNWALGGAGDTTDTPDRDSDQDNSQTQKSINELSLGDVQIIDGQITYQGSDGKTWEASNADLKISLDSLDNTLGVDGTMDVQGQPSVVTFDFTTPRSYIETGRANMVLDMTVGDNQVDLGIALTDELTFDGNLDVDFPALRALFSLVGADLGTEKGFERLKLDGPVEGNSSRIAFGKDTKLEFDKISGSGEITIDVSGARPSITGTVNLGTLNLLPYLPAKNQNLTASRSGEANSFPEWSDEVMDFSALRSVDLGMTISTGEIVTPITTVGASDLTLTAKAGDVTANVTRTSLYGGAGSGTITLNAQGTPRIGVDFDLKKVDAGFAAQELAGITRLEGTGNVNITNLTARGQSQSELVRSLNGSIELDLDDGAIKGVNLGKIGRAALQTYDTLTSENGGFSGVNLPSLVGSFNDVVTQARGPAEETDFSSFLVKLNAANGVVTSEAMEIEGPYYRVTGNARVNLPQQNMQMTLLPAVEAEGSDVRRELPLPVLVSGTFNNPKVGVEWQSLARNVANDKIKDVLGRAGIDAAEGETLEDTLRNTAREELQRRLLGDQKTDEEGTEETKEKRPEDVLIEQGLGALFGSSKKKEDDGGQ